MDWHWALVWASEIYLGGFWIQPIRYRFSYILIQLPGAGDIEDHISLSVVSCT